MQNTKRVFCHILLDCAVPRFISKQPVMREKLIEMVLPEAFKMDDQTILSKELIKQSLVDNRETLRKYGVKRIGLFGSYVRGTATTESDIDIIVELERLTFRDYMGLALFLEDLFKRDVDLVTVTSIKPRLKPYIEKEIEYVANL